MEELKINFLSKNNIAKMSYTFRISEQEIFPIMQNYARNSVLELA